MAVKKEFSRGSLMVMALLITVLLFMIVLLIGTRVGESREQFIDEEMQRVYRDISEIQSFFLMSDTYGDDIACVAFRTKLRDLDRNTWNLGIKLDQYRIASEEFLEDPFYLEQKRLFNENQLVYMMLLTQLKQRCGYNDQAIISFYYTNGEDCPKCDDQSYVLTSINQQYDERVSIFSYDTELNLSTVSVLVEYYNITEYPCIVVEEEVYCGIRSKEFVVEKICASIEAEFCST